MSKVLLFDKIPMTSIKILKEAIPALMDCLDTRFCVATMLSSQLSGTNRRQILRRPHRWTLAETINHYKM